MTLRKIYAYLILIGAIALTSSSYLLPFRRELGAGVQDMDISSDNEYDSGYDSEEEVLQEIHDPTLVVKAWCIERYYGRQGDHPDRDALAETLFNHLSREHPTLAHDLTRIETDFYTTVPPEDMPPANSIGHLEELLDRQELWLAGTFQPDPDLIQCALTEAVLNYVEQAAPEALPENFTTDLRAAINERRNQDNQGE